LQEPAWFEVRSAADVAAKVGLSKREITQIGYLLKVRAAA
jgi:hypothetical protein